MFDCHYDLLTYILMKKENPDFLKNYCTINVNIETDKNVKVKI